MSLFIASPKGLITSSLKAIENIPSHNLLNYENQNLYFHNERFFV